MMIQSVISQSDASWLGALRAVTLIGTSSEAVVSTAPVSTKRRETGGIPISLRQLGLARVSLERISFGLLRFAESNVVNKV
jgi:hypothetical protein